MVSFDNGSKLSNADLVRVLVSDRVKILAYIESLVRDEHLAEDIFQDLCMLAVEKADTIQGRSHLLRWMRTTARFLSLNALQARHQRDLSLDDRVAQILEPAWESHDDDQMSDRMDALRSCVDRLPRRGRQLIEKRYIQGMSYEQLSEETGRPVASLYVTFSRLFVGLNFCINAKLRQIQGGMRA